MEIKKIVQSFFRNWPTKNFLLLIIITVIVAVMNSLFKVDF